MHLIILTFNTDVCMSNNDGKSFRILLISLLITILTFSNLLTFSSTISSKPNEAGYWMKLVFDISVGISIMSLVIYLQNKKK